MDRKYELTRNNKMIPLMMIAVGAIAIIGGFMTNPTRTWAALLQNDFYFTAMALAGTFFVAFNYAAQSGWTVGIKRVPEAMGGFLKFGMPLLIIIFLAGHHDLYHWTHHTREELSNPSSEAFDPVLAGKLGYLNLPFYLTRLALYAVLWIGFTMVLRKHSLQEDIDGDINHYKRSVVLSAIFLVIFAVSSSTAAWDIIMSLDAHWFSTLFGWYIFAGLFVSGLAMIGMFVLYLRKKGYMDHLNDSHFHDIGKFMFAFSIFWTYLWFSQFMLIWYANLPEEVVYYQTRWRLFKFLWVFNLLINFIAPFFVLMTRDAKRKKQVFFLAGVIILIGHWIDMYVLVMPGTVGALAARISWIEIGTAIGFLGGFILSTLSELSKAAIVPKNHPMLQESLHHHI